jgi:[ribosomal protein S18]-alanine N-acetyltransferase
MDRGGNSDLSSNLADSRSGQMLHANGPAGAARLLRSSAGARVISQTRVALPFRPVTFRVGTLADVGRLEALERRAFTQDRLARRSFARFLGSRNASLIVAADAAAVCGYALVLFRARSKRARLYSIAVDAENGGRRIGSGLLSAAEAAAHRRGSKVMCLEVRARNTPAMNLYRKFGYGIIDRVSGYYGDGSDALRLRKTLHDLPG